MSENSGLVTAVLVDADNGSEIVLGELEWGPQNRLEIVSSPPNAADFLVDLVETLNQKQDVCVKVPGEELYSLEAKLTSRDEDGFVDALKEHLFNLYSIELRSTSDFQTQAADFADL